MGQKNENRLHTYDHRYRGNKQTKDKDFEIAIISYPNLLEFDRKSICEDMLVVFCIFFKIAVGGMVTKSRLCFDINTG